MKNEKGESIAEVILEKGDVMDLDTTLASLIFQGLFHYKIMVQNDPMHGTPGKLLREMFPTILPGEHTEEQIAEADAEWFRILDRMVYAFDQQKPFIPDSDPHFIAKRTERLDIEEEGRILFAKYFNNLWN